MKKICVFCGSSPGARPEYSRAAQNLGLLLAQKGLELVYGGSRVGLMGLVARTVVSAGGTVTGVITQKLLEDNMAYSELGNRLLVARSMHERKSKMAELADAFIGLPGGLGTLEEVAEILTWAQLGIHQKPCGLLNTCGYYNGLTAFLDTMLQEQFVDEENRRVLLVEENAADLLERFAHYQPPRSSKAAWVLKLEAQAGQLQD